MSQNGIIDRADDAFDFGLEVTQNMLVTSAVLVGNPVTTTEQSIEHRPFNCSTGP